MAGNSSNRTEHPAGQECPVRGHVEARERHVGRADLEGHDVVAEGSDRERHDAHEDHDGPVHRPELVVELGRHHAPRHRVFAEELPDPGKRPPGIGELPAHQHHQAETDQQEDERGQPVLQSDGLVIDGEDVLAPEGQLVTGAVSMPMIGVMALPVADALLGGCSVGRGLCGH